MTQAMEIEERDCNLDTSAKTSLADEGPATPAKSINTEPNTSDLKTSSSDGLVSASAPTADDVETPPKKSQPDEEMATDDEQEGEDEDDSKETLGLQLYYILLRMLFKELDLYANVEAGLLDPKKQMLVYHHAARLHEMRVEALGALNGDLSMTANLPGKYQRALRKLRKKLQESGQLDGLQELTETHVFGHDHAIRFMDGMSLPAGAQDSCVWLREKPHAKSDQVKQISPFRDVIKFNCNQNPMLLMEDISMGLALTVEKIYPVAYLVVSPFLRKPELLPPEEAMSNWGQIEGLLRDHLIDFVAKDSEGWRGFVQRRANMISKGSLTVIQRVLRLRPRTEGLEPKQVTEIQDLQEEVEELRERARKAEEVVKKRLGDKNEKEYSALEAQLLKVEKELVDVTAVSERMRVDKEKLEKDLDLLLGSGAQLEERCNTAEQSLLTTRKQVQQLEREKDDIRTSAEARISSIEAGADKQKAELELMSCGVQEILVEMKKIQFAKKQALEREERLKAEIQLAKKKTLEKEERLKAEFQTKMASVKEDLQAKTSEAARATELATEATRKETVALATLQVKTEAVETLSASNVSLRAEAAAAKAEVDKAVEKVTAMENMRNDSLQKEIQARDELQVKVDEIEGLKMAVGEQTALASSAQENSAKAIASKEEAEKKMLECSRLQAEATAHLQVKTEEAIVLTNNCSALRVEVDKLTQSLRAEVDRVAEVERAKADRVAEVERAMTALIAQIEVKQQTVESLTTSNASLRAEAAIAKTDADKAIESARNMEVERDAARDSASSVKKELQDQVSETSRLNAVAELAKEDLAVAELLREEAHQGAMKARQVEAETAARLQVKIEEATNLTSTCTSLRQEVDSLTRSLTTETDRAADATRAADAAAIQLDLKTRSIESAMANNAALRASLAVAKSDVEKAVEKAAVWEREKDEAHKRILEVRQEVQSELDEINNLKESIKAAEKLKEKAEEEAHKSRVDGATQLLLKENAEEAAAQARSNEAKAVADYQVKTEEASKLFNECAALRAEMARLSENIARADERAASAQSCENAAKVALNLKSDDVDRLTGLNVELRAEVIKSQKEIEEAEKRACVAESNVDTAHRVRDQAYAELRGKVTALEAMSAKMSSLRSEVTASAKAEAKAEFESTTKKAINEAEEQVSSARQLASEAQRNEAEVSARLQVKSDEAVRLTEECSSLRAEIAILREKSEASSGIVKALGASCERLTQELAEAKRSRFFMAPEQSFGGGELTEEIAEGGIVDSEFGITLEDLNTALTQEADSDNLVTETIAALLGSPGTEAIRSESDSFATETITALRASPGNEAIRSESNNLVTATIAALHASPVTEAIRSDAVGGACGRRLRCKGPQPQSILPDDAVGTEMAETSTTLETTSVVGSSRRLRSKTAAEDPMQKRPKTIDERAATDAD